MWAVHRVTASGFWAVQQILMWRLVLKHRQLFCCVGSALIGVIATWVLLVLVRGPATSKGLPVRPEPVIAPEQRGLVEEVVLPSLERFQQTAERTANQHRARMTRLCDMLDRCLDRLEQQNLSGRAEQPQTQRDTPPITFPPGIQSFPPLPAMPSGLSRSAVTGGSDVPEDGSVGAPAAARRTESLEEQVKNRICLANLALMAQAMSMYSADMRLNSFKQRFCNLDPNDQH